MRADARVFYPQIWGKRRRAWNRIDRFDEAFVAFGADDEIVYSFDDDALVAVVAPVRIIRRSAGHRFTVGLSDPDSDPMDNQITKRKKTEKSVCYLNSKRYRVSIVVVTPHPPADPSYYNPFILLIKLFNPTNTSFFQNQN